MDTNGMVDRCMDAMGSMMGGSATDAMFLRMMIPHHQLGIEMAELALEEAEHPDLEELAQTTIAEQAAEVELMRGYLKEIDNEQHR